MTISGPTHTLVQLTDLHLVAEGDPLPGGVDTAALLDRALQTVTGMGPGPDGQGLGALVLSGDLTEHGRPEEYRRLRAIVEPAAQRLGVPVVLAAGNHDDRGALREHLLGEAPSTAPFDHVVHVGALRIVVLDSTVPGQAHGALRPGQLAWLRALLAEPAPAGTVLVLHHPPLPSASPLATAIPLLHRDELGAELTGTDVRLVLAGHTHVASAGTLAGIPVWTGGPLATTVDALAPGASLRTLGAPSVSRIDLFPGDLLTTSVPIAAEIMADVPAEEMEPRLADLREAAGVA
ncbi:metallophosphoesterase [Pseudonocardia xinjiangensis]|uniref:metallophosphoesterase n=1 Tax=Pseudonocardia xinjiangensis TaxID=75289 RepID=UPI003D9115B2